AQEQYAQFLLTADQIETLLGSHPDQPLLIQRGANEALTLLRNHGILTDSEWDHAGDWSQLSTPQRETLQARAGQVGAMLARVQASAPRQGTDLERESAKEQVRAVVDRLKDTPLFSERQPVLAAAQAQANGQFRLSLTNLQAYLRTHPSDASAWFLTGRAATMTGDYSEAVHAYSMHIALQPKSALGYFHRAIVQDLRRQPAVAILDVQQALRHDPNLMAGRILLAQLHMTLGQNSEASAVLNDILRGAEPPVRAWFMRAAVKDKLGDKAGSAADRLSGLSQPATDAPTLVARGFARMKAEPRAALKDFEHAERLAPESMIPVQNQAYIYGELLNDPVKAAAVLDRLAERHPDYTLATASQAVYYARAGRTEEALKAAEKALKQGNDGSLKYRIACVYSILSPKKPELTASALRLLASALQQGFGQNILASDADLDAIRRDPQFELLTKYCQLLATLQTTPR
ncbi:MAG: tetratricopeptide repeat protein, partial [Gemmataceae bacterium]